MSGSDGASPGFTVERTASKGFDRKDTHIKDLQLHPDDLDRFEGVDDGDFLRVSADHGDRSLSIYGRVEPRTAAAHGEGLARDRVGLGGPERDALGVAVGDVVEIDRPGFDPPPPTQRAFNRLIGVRPVTCRVRKAINVDAGHKVCRMRPDVKQAIGIEWGDRVVVQSADGRLRAVKALPITDDHRELTDRRERDGSDAYPPPFRETDLGEKVGPGGDLPRMHVAYAAREELGIAERPHSGVYQPVKVHRDTRDVFYRLLDSLTVPFLLGVVAVIAAFDVSVAAKVGALVGAAAVVLLSTAFRGRRVLLE